MQDFADLLRHSIDLEDRIKWLEKGLKLIIKLANDDESGLVMAAQSILDGEPTTADKHNDEHKSPNFHTIIQNIGYRGEDE